MVKFRKHLESNKVRKWSNKYINYKSLKQLINEIYINFRFTGTQSANAFDIKNEKNELNLYEPINEGESGANRLSDGNKNTMLLKRFIHELEKELKNFYYSYCNIERELFIKLNKLLHNKQSYHKMDYLTLLSECQSIYLLTLDTRLFTDFAYINLEGLRKIIKKFDKKFKKFYKGKSIVLRYIKSRLDNIHSDLNYILQLKIVDELILLIENTCRDLLSKVQNIKEEKEKIRKKNRNQLISDAFSNEGLIKEIGNYEILVDVETKVQKFMREIRDNLYSININGQYRFKYLNLGTFFGFEEFEKIEKNNLNAYYGANDADYSKFMKEKAENLFLVRQFVPTEAFEELKNMNIDMISEMNIKNINFVISERAISQILISMNYGILFKLLEEKNQTLFGIGITLIYIGQYIGKNLLKCLLKNNKHFKLSMVISGFLLLISGTILNIHQFDFIKIAKKETIFLITLLISNFFLGMGTSGKIEKKYIMTFTPKNSIYFFIKKYDFGILIGRTIGFFIGGILLSFEYYLYIYWICIIFLFLIIIVYFNDPSKPHFSIIKKNLNIHESLLIELTGDKEINTESFIIDDPPSRENNNPSMMLDEMNDERKSNKSLQDINNKYDDANLIPTNIILLINRHNNTQDKRLIILNCILFITHLINLSLQVIFPIHLMKGWDKEHNISSENNFYQFYRMSFPYILYFIFSFIYNKTLAKNKFLIPLLRFQCIILLIVLIVYIFEMDLFVFSYTILISINLIIQRKIKRFIALTFPNDIRIKKFNVSCFFASSILIAKILGSMLHCFLNMVKEFKYMFFFYVCTCLIILGILTFFYSKYINFERDKMRARIIKRKLYKDF